LLLNQTFQRVEALLELFVSGHGLPLLINALS